MRKNISWGTSISLKALCQKWTTEEKFNSIFRTGLYWVCPIIPFNNLLEKHFSFPNTILLTSRCKAVLEYCTCNVNYTFRIIHSQIVDIVKLTMFHWRQPIHELTYCVNMYCILTAHVEIDGNPMFKKAQSWEGRRVGAGSVRCRRS